VKVSIPDEGSAVKLNCPEPLVINASLELPSLVGKEYASLTVRVAGFEPTSTIEAVPLSASV